MRSNYDMFTHKLQSAHGLQFKLCCRKWSSQGHRQSPSLQKW